MTSTDTEGRLDPRSEVVHDGPPPEATVTELTEVLDLMENFTSNEQRARYLLSSDFMRDHGAAAAARLRTPRRHNTHH